MTGCLNQQIQKKMCRKMEGKGRVNGGSRAAFLSSETRVDLMGPWAFLIVGFYICGVWEHEYMNAAFVFIVALMCVLLPQPPILSRGSSRYDFGDEDAGVVAHVRVVCSTCYAEAQA